MATSSILNVLLIYNFLFRIISSSKDNHQCTWKSVSGIKFNLNPLKRHSTDESYYIEDGDIPCSPEIEPSYSYLFNICEDVTNIPSVCGNSTGMVIQYLDQSSDKPGGFCKVISKSYSKDNFPDFQLINSLDPSYGIAIILNTHDECYTGGLKKTLIEVQCENIKHRVLSATEPKLCEHHLVIQSYYGCPLDCPVTEAGLCNSHGHCAFDTALKRPYCYCNDGYSGASCQPSVTPIPAYNTLSLQIGLLLTLLVVSLVLMGVISYLVVSIAKFRKEQASDYQTLAETDKDSETTVKF